MQLLLLGLDDLLVEHPLVVARHDAHEEREQMVEIVQHPDRDLQPSVVPVVLDAPEELRNPMSLLWKSTPPLCITSMTSGVKKGLMRGVE